MTTQPRSLIDLYNLDLEIICFDAGHVLLRPDINKLVEIWNKHFPDRPVSFYSLWSAEQEYRVRSQKEVEPIETRPNEAHYMRPYFKFLAQLFATNWPADRINAFVNECCAFQRVHNFYRVVGPDVVIALRLLGYHFRLIVISNADGTVERDLERLGLRCFFKYVIDSHKVGCAKPDPKIFKLALEPAGVAPNRALHIDDNYRVGVQGAMNAGLRAVQYDAEGTFDPPNDAPYCRNLVDLAKILVASKVGSRL